ncbi:uncharacterized protein LOC144876064 [Branchiostoma floridae x Branchiostoma japonicum]
MANDNANKDLMYATFNGSVQRVEAALKAGADIDFNQLGPSSGSSTALFMASAMGHVDVVRLLLRKGASVQKRVFHRNAPLHAAAAEGWTEIVELLVQHGATLDVRDAFNNTPLMGAADSNEVDTVRRLIEFGARPDLTDGLKASRFGIDDEKHSVSESVKLLQEARKSKLLRCCNPKCGKPGYRKTLKLCARCKLTRYCSRDCQIQHWSVGHKKCCGH